VVVVVGRRVPVLVVPKAIDRLRLGTGVWSGEGSSAGVWRRTDGGEASA
jgi:hypothetical protein